MVNVIVSIYYCALVVKAAYNQGPEDELSKISLSFSVKSLTVAMVIVIVIGGIFPQYFFGLARAGPHG
jgi:NADH:ubiquinone oxidoreductase subunit 2 (subunit N)